MPCNDDVPSGYRPTVLAVAQASFLLPLAVTAPSTALPDIGRSLHAAPVATQWLVNGYAVAFAVAVLAAGSIADRVGRRRVLRAGTIVFAVTSGLIALAPDILIADLLRVPEAIGASAILASGGAVLSHLATGARRARAFGVLGASFGSGLALGPIIAGVLAPVGWRAMFGVIVLFAIVAFGLESRAAESRNPAGHRIDVIGMAAFASALLALSTAFIEAPSRGWSSATTLGLLVIALALMLVFAFVELRHRTPMFDVRLFARPAFLAVTCQPFTITFGFVILLVFLPPFVERAAGLSVLGASLVLLPLTAPVVVIPLLAGRLISAVGIRGTLVLASALIAVGCGLLTQISADAALGSLAPGLLVFGLGVGSAFAVMDNAAIGAVPADRAGTASGMFNTMRLTGEAVAIAAAGGVLTTLTATHLGSGDHRLAADAVQGRIGGPQASAAVADALHVVALGLGAPAALGALATYVALRPRQQHDVRSEGERAQPGGCRYAVSVSRSGSGVDPSPLCLEDDADGHG